MWSWPWLRWWCWWCGAGRCPGGGWVWGVQRRRLPLAWLVFGVLYLVPSLQLGMVGVGRYANECFPPFVGAGQILDRWSRRSQCMVLAASTVGLILFAFVAARYEL